MSNAELGRRYAGLRAAISRLGARLPRRLRDRLPARISRRARPARRAHPARRLPSNTRLCREGWYYLLVLGFVFGGAMLRDVNLLLMLAAMLAGPMLFNWRLVVVTLRGLEVRRRAPRGVCAGDLLVVNVEVSNTRKKVASWAVIVEEQIHAEDEATGGRPLRPTVFFSYVPPGQSHAGVYRGRLTRRGRYRLGPLRISTRFPFGLFERTVTLGPTDTLTVFPRLGRLTRHWITRHREAFEGTQRRERQHSRVSGDFFGVRQWRHGDSRRWIHWRSSARLGTLVVRQFEQHRNRDVAVLVDLWQPERPGADDLDHVELAVSFAATVAADVCHKGGSSLLLGTTGPQPECTRGPSSAALLEEVMERLAVAEASSEDRLPELLDRTLRHIEPGTELVLVSPRAIDLSDAERFAALWSTPTRQAVARRIRLVNSATRQLDEYFQPE